MRVARAFVAPSGQCHRTDKPSSRDTSSAEWVESATSFYLLLCKIGIFQVFQMLKNDVAGVEGFGSACALGKLVEPFLNFGTEAYC